MMLKQIVLLVLITFVPALELRASIPWGIFGNENWGISPGLMSWPLVVLVCTVANILLGLAVFWGLAPILHWLERFQWFRQRFEPLMQHAQRRIRPYVERYGELGVALFIGIPLPGSGVYTGAVGAFVLGLDRRKFAVANALGVCIAATAVTGISLAVKAGIEWPWLEWLIKQPTP
ncbi:MAG: small multi-drug export protein [Candidatus Pacebacteria bacterium]|nr:small multi-drug export protein [Candidatus Paceibacterota bacterium]